MKAAVFDLDGVLCNTQELHESCYIELGRTEFNKELTEKDLEGLRGVLRKEGARNFLTAVGQSPTEENIHSISERKNKVFQELVSKKGKSLVLPGTVALLERLAEASIPMIIASASANASFVLTKTGLMPYFSKIVDISKISQGKPNPAIFLSAAAMLGQKPCDCVAYEDAPTGIEAAHQAGMYTVGIGTEGNRTIQGLSDILSWKGLYDNISDATSSAQLFIFDAGNVMIDSISCLEGIIKEYGMDSKTKKEFLADFTAYAAPLMDGNISTPAYWKHLEHMLGIRVEGEPFAKHFHPMLNEQTMALVKLLKSEGKRVVLGSNTFQPHLEIFQGQLGFSKLFDAVYASNEIGLYKPQPAFFRYILKKEGYPADKTYFIDDLAENRAAAAEVGISTLLYEGPQRNNRLHEAFRKQFSTLPI
ncbi:MAG: HAD-IA family hydrolase [Spirochaetia bacterium]|jgi:beta-phosphoglucomutase|nr:HAD-IA family hydrolase [Spirochaetia bacterium]